MLELGGVVGLRQSTLMELGKLGLVTIVLGEITIKGAKELVDN